MADMKLREPEVTQNVVREITRCFQIEGITPYGSSAWGNQTQFDRRVGFDSVARHDMVPPKLRKILM